MTKEAAGDWPFLKILTLNFPILVALKADLSLMIWVHGELGLVPKLHLGLGADFRPDFRQVDCTNPNKINC
jgi:hypothetical protein